VHHRFAVNAFVYLTVISRWGGVAWRVGYEDDGVVRSPVAGCWLLVAGSS